MANAWGASWGTSWGVSWGSGDAATEQPITGGGNWRLGLRKRRRQGEAIETRGYERPFESTIIIEFPPPLEIEEEIDDEVILLAITRILH